jgi:hypothetical protein
MTARDVRHRRANCGGSQSCDRYIRVIIAKDYTHLRLTLRRDGFFDPV